MNRLTRSWELFKTSLVVMTQNKTLLVFPILTSVLGVFIVCLFLMPVAFQPTGYSYLSQRHWDTVSHRVFNVRVHAGSHVEAPAVPGGPGDVTYSANWSVNNSPIKPLWIGYFALMYFAAMFMATFLNVAFYKEILNALSGQPVSIADGLSFAITKWKIILMWTLFAGIVGYIIKMLEQRFGIFGQFIMKFIGAVWSVACVFVIPVIITEQETSNPFVVLKKSALTLTKTWGESLIGYVGVSFGSSIILLCSFLWLGCGIAIAVAIHSLLLGTAAVLIWLTGICIFSYLMSVASNIFRCALFLYASQGAMPAPYNEEMAALAWKMKKK